MIRRATLLWGFSPLEKMRTSAAAIPCNAVATRSMCSLPGSSLSGHKLTRFPRRTYRASRPGGFTPFTG